MSFNPIHMTSTGLAARYIYIVVVGMLFLSACGSGGSSSCSDPIGTYTTTVGTYGVGGNYQLYVGPQTSDFVQINSNAAVTNAAYGGFMENIGAQDCLGNITSFPAGATQQTLTIVLGDTYAVKFGQVVSGNGVQNYVPDGDYALITFVSFNGGLYTVKVSPGIGSLP